MHGRSISVVVVLLLHGLLCLAQPAPTPTDEINENDSFQLPVSPPVVPGSAEERREHYRAMEAKDLLRQRQMVMKLRHKVESEGGRRQAWESGKVPEVMSNTSMFELPMRSAVNIAHVGAYIVSVRMGTPALPFNMALDTANDLTWINCRLRRRRGKHYGRPHVQQAAATTTLSVDTEGEPVKVAKNWYRPALSSSWRRYRCSQPACAVLPHNTCESPNQTSSCTYYQMLEDGTTTSGIYGQEKATIALSGGRVTKLTGLVLGCSTFEAGGSVDTHDGVLSLGNSEISFGIIAAGRFGARFSFCLLATSSDSDASSYLTFGPNPAIPKGATGTMETPIAFILLGYGPRVTGISVGGNLLDIPPEVWDPSIIGGGVVLDTGTSVTGLVPLAYAAVTKALDRHLSHLERVTDVPGFEFCYKWTFTGDGVDPAHNVTIPKFVLEFKGGARLEPDAKSIFMPEVAPGVVCQAFRQVVQGPVVIGNVLMQEHIWEFDLGEEKLRFRKDKCLDHRD